jgi:ATP-dependent Clp protease ATP-binding subunit ClpA
MNERFSAEARRALFTAMVVARAAGETEVTIERVLSAVLRAPLMPLDLGAAPDEAGAHDQEFERLLDTVVQNLAEAHIEFGSREHIASFQPLQLAPDVRDALENVHTVLGEVPSSSVTPAHILIALAEEPYVAEKLARVGITRERLVGAAQRLAT